MELLSFDELTPEQKARNRAAVADLTKDTVYEFNPPSVGIPLERRIKGAEKAGEPITFSKARYMGWREPTQEHTFLALTDEGEFFVPLFMCGGGSVLTPA